MKIRFCHHQFVHNILHWWNLAIYHHNFHKKQEEELLSYDNLSEKINDLTKKVSDFAIKFEHVFSELQISKTCNSILHKQIVDLKWSSLDNSQYLRREMKWSPQFRWMYQLKEKKFLSMILKLVTVSRKKKTSSSNSKAEN